MRIKTYFRFLLAAVVSLSATGASAEASKVLEALELVVTKAGASITTNQKIGWGHINSFDADIGDVKDNSWIKLEKPTSNKNGTFTYVIEGDIDLSKVTVVLIDIHNEDQSWRYKATATVDKSKKETDSLSLVFKKVVSKAIVPPIKALELLVTKTGLSITTNQKIGWGHINSFDAAIGDVKDNTWIKLGKPTSNENGTFTYVIDGDIDLTKVTTVLIDLYNEDQSWRYKATAKVDESEKETDSVSLVFKKVVSKSAEQIAKEEQAEKERIRRTAGHNSQEMKAIQLINNICVNRGHQKMIPDAELRRRALENSDLQAGFGGSGHYTGYGNPEIAYFGPTTPESTVNGWVASGSHNALLCAGSRIGVGLVGGNSWTAVYQ